MRICEALWAIGAAVAAIGACGMDSEAWQPFGILAVIGAAIAAIGILVYSTRKRKRKARR